MGYCGPRNDYFFPLTGALSELAGVPFGSAELRHATSCRIARGIRVHFRAAWKELDYPMSGVECRATLGFSWFFPQWEYFL